MMFYYFDKRFIEITFPNPCRIKKRSAFCMLMVCGIGHVKINYKNALNLYQAAAYRLYTSKN